MLVISRKQEEFIQIGEDILVKIIKTGRGSVKIGIEAPGDRRILRGESEPEMNSLAACLSPKSAKTAFAPATSTV